MYLDASRLGSVVVFWTLAALFGSMGWGVKSVPEWVKFFLQLLAVIFTVIAVMTTLDWATHQATARLKNYNYARTASAVQLASALKGLTIKQTEIVARHDVLEVRGLLGEDGRIA